MSNKQFTDGGRADKNMNLIVRGIGLIIFLIVIFMTFMHNPHVNADPFTNETMWEAVHPFRWYKIFGLAGMVFFFLYVLGLAGKVIYAFTGARSPNSSGLVHVVFVISVILIITMYL